MTANTFDSNGNLVQTVTPNGHTLSSGFTALNQLKTITIDGQQKWVYQYDSNGLLVKVNNGARSFTYKPDGLPATEVDQGHMKTYRYNANSGLQELAYTTGTRSSTVNYDYTGLDQVQSIAKDNQSLISYQYNDVGALEQANRTNGIITKGAYDQGDQLISYGDYTGEGSKLREYSYTYDSNGNVKTVQTNTGSIDYAYDALNQLTQETLLDGTVIHYDFDQVGNRTQKREIKSGQELTITYSYNNANQLTSVDGQAYQYDKNGNLLDDGKRTYIYDALDQLIEVKDQAGQRIIQYDYDDKGRRIQSFSPSGTINYFYDGDEVIYETDGSNHVLREYIWDDSGSPVAMIKNGHTYYYHLNGHGDVVALTDEDGQEVAQYEYDAWGNVLSQSGTLAEENPYRYASYKYDTETGFYYLLSRYYNPQHGNFITLDLEQDSDLDNPLNRNGYSYSLNNPVSLVDDVGNFPFIPIIIIVIVKIVAKEVVKTAVKKVAKKAATKAIKKATTKTYQTYTKTHPKTGKVYTGRTSGKGRPLENIAKRDANHHMNKYDMLEQPLIDHQVTKMQYVAENSK